MEGSVPSTSNENPIPPPKGGQPTPPETAPTSEDLLPRPGFKLDLAAWRSVWGLQGISISETMVLAAGPAAAYLLAFYYESGYCKHFNIPAALISIEVTAVITALAAVASTVALGAMLILPMLPAGEPRSEIGRSMGIVFSALLPLAVLTVFGGWPWLLLVLSFIVLTALEFGIAWIRYKHKGTLEQRLEAARIGEMPERPRALHYLVARTGPWMFRGLYWLWVGTIVAHALGRNAAEAQRDFLVAEGNPTYVVLRCYGGKFVCSELDAENNVGRRFVVLSLDAAQIDSNTPVFSLKRLDPPTVYSPTAKKR